MCVSCLPLLAFCVTCCFSLHFTLTHCSLSLLFVGPVVDPPPRRTVDRGAIGAQNQGIRLGLLLAAAAAAVVALDPGVGQCLLPVVVAAAIIVGLDRGIGQGLILVITAQHPSVGQGQGHRDHHRGIK